MISVAWRSMMAEWHLRCRRRRPLSDRICFAYPGGGSDGADLFAFGDLVEQFRQHRAVTVAAGDELHRPDVRSGGVHRQMQLAPPVGDCQQSPAGQRLAAALRPVFSGLPLVISAELDPGAVDQQIERPIGAPLWDPDGQCLLPAAKG